VVREEGWQVVAGCVEVGQQVVGGACRWQKMCVCVCGGMYAVQ